MRTELFVLLVDKTFRQIGMKDGMVGIGGLNDD
jgi:hypothetical protein